MQLIQSNLSSNQHSNNYTVTVDNIDKVLKFGDIEKMVEVLGKEDTCKILNYFSDYESICKPINFDLPFIIELGWRYNSENYNSYKKIADLIGEEAANKLVMADFIQYSVMLDLTYPIKQFKRALIED